MITKRQVRFYFIMGSQDVPVGKDPLAVLAEALEAGVTCFQLREKGPGAKQGLEKVRFARECQALCRKHHIPFIINDDVELALALEADGVHLGQDDVPVAQWREHLGKRNMLLGRSTHNEEEVEQAIKEGADYVGLGALYPSLSKEDTLHQLTPESIAQIIERFPDFPIVGIGGITVDRVEKAFGQGFSGIAMISTLIQADSLTETMEQIQEAALQGEEQFRESRLQDRGEKNE